MNVFVFVYVDIFGIYKTKLLSSFLLLADLNY